MLEPLLQVGDTVASFWTLSLGGLLGGLTAGLFGVGGGVIVIPLLISLGIPPRLAAGSMNVAIISNAADALAHDLPRRKVDVGLGLWMGAAAVVGGQAGTWALGALGKPVLVDQLIRGGFLVLLFWLAVRLLRPRRPPGERVSRWLALPLLRHRGPWQEEPYSLVAPLGVAFAGGVVASLLGVGGGILYVPVLLAFFHRPIQDLVPVSQLAVLLGSLSVSTGHVLHTGNLDPRLVLILVLTGSVGTVVGSRLKGQLDSRLLERLLAGILLVAALRLAWQGLGWGGTGSPTVAQAQVGEDWLPGFRAWCGESRWQLWLGTVGLAIGLTPALSWLQHKVLDRLGR
jgi:uncharacterized membrane protein YfcA